MDAPIAVLAGALLYLSDCGGGDDHYLVPQTRVVTHILSDPSLDGDIEQTGPNSYTVTQGMSSTVQTVLAGIDPLSQTDVAQFVAVNVTFLMVRAQQLGLVDFQVRVMENIGPANFTLIEIDDSTASDRPQHAPQLTVTYR